MEIGHTILVNSEEERQEIIDRIFTPASEERIKQIRKNFEKSRKIEIKSVRSLDLDE